MGDVSSEGIALGNLGNDWHKLGDLQKAIHYHERSIQIARKVGDVSGEGMAQGNLGNDYYKLGDLQKAINCHERQQEIAKKIGDSSSEGMAYENLGNDYQKLGDFQRAIHYHERQQEIARKEGDVSSEGTAYCNLGDDYRELGDLQKAIYYHERQLKIVRKLGDVSREGTAYNNLGIDYQTLGDFKNAIHYHERCLEIGRKFGHVSSEGKAHCNLGNDYHKLADYEKAKYYHEHHLEIARKVGDVLNEGVACCNLGNDYQKIGDFKKALNYHERHLKISRKLGDVSSEGVACCNLGNDFKNLADLRKAIYYHESHLEIARRVGDVSSEGIACCNLGNDFQSLGDFQKAIHYHERRLEIARKVGDVSSEGIAYGNLGNAYYSLGDHKKAMNYTESGLKIAKEMGEKVAIGQLYCNLGTIFQTMGSLYKAEDCYQHSVATFNDARHNPALNDDWKVSLRNLYQISYVSLWRLLLKQGKIIEALLSAEQGRAQALNDLMKFKYSSKQYEAESCTEVKTNAGILSGFPSNTVFLALEDKEVILWVFQKGKDVQLRRKQIPDGQVNAEDFLDTTMKKIRGRAVVKCEDRSLNMTRDESLADERSPPNERQSQSTNPWNSALRLLYEIVISPIRDLLLDNEVVFVPEGPLCLAPLVAFMDSGSNYLCEFFRARVIPSLTSLKLIADCPADYHMKSGALVVGDPWIQDVTFEGTKFSQLPFAREEAQMIGRILHTKPLIGEHATKNEVLKRLSSVALVHIAAHGRMATGEIALAPNPPPVSRAPVEEDFVLTMRDVLNAEMRARLVVLSCCHSARGEIKAEGVVGIARAFLGAGARSVLVSLWAVDDEATMEFMKIFYQHLVKGESASTALNQAMRCMRESDEFSAVDYWAPFVLIGDDVTIELGGQE